MVNIYFYIPKKYWRDDFPAADDFNWENYGIGIYCWVLQTYNKLKNLGYEYILTNELPEEGIIISHKAGFKDQQKPNGKQLFVCLQADWGRHTYSHVHCVQNKNQIKLQNVPITQRFFMPGPIHYTRLWPQPGLISRNPDRQDRFENIYYLGNTENLAPELQTNEWRKSIEKMDLNWKVVTDKSEWSNYSNVDCIIAVRSFDTENHNIKPASKLLNSWIANVPAILGYESAYRAERQSDFDYIEVLNTEDALKAIQQLKQNINLRRNIIKNGQHRALELTDDKLAKFWHDLIENELRREYDIWLKKSFLMKKLFFLNRFISLLLSKIKDNL